jgi:hypothetical protein
MPSRTKKSWAQKLADPKGLPKIVTLTGKPGAPQPTTLLVPAPLEVDAQMRRVRKGKLVTTNEIRAALARHHKTDAACPLCTGIFAWIAAHAAAEAAPRKPATPYWRTLKIDGEINPKFPGGPRAIARLLKAEGHKITKRGNRFFVENYEKAIAKL